MDLQSHFTYSNFGSGLLIHQASDDKTEDLTLALAE
jgi:hypothetical protein